MSLFSADVMDKAQPRARFPYTKLLHRGEHQKAHRAGPMRFEDKWLPVF
jgi:hypothetical protein